MRFVDEITFHIASGPGGPGAVSFLREKFVPRGGPDGGDGGRGGALIFEATTSRNTLVDYRFNKTYRAKPGSPGSRRNMNGRSGEDLVLFVPVGTVIYDVETDEVLADLDAPEAQWRLPGGRGGKGNTHFATATHRTPRMAQEGEPGTDLHVRLELKLIADVGLLGFPNAGKSTLISRISAAKPKIGAYPFTTLVPNLGVVSLGEGRSFVVADIPGLIEGASDGAGLGHQFLRHLERCRVVVQLVPADGEEDLVEGMHVLRNELRTYNPALADRVQIVALSKIDLLDEASLAEKLGQLTAAGVDAMPLSAVSGAGLPALLHRIEATLRDAPPPGTEPDKL